MNEKDWKVAYQALMWQIEIGGCAVAGPGELTYECAADRPCGLCVMRRQRDTALDACRALLESNRLSAKSDSRGFGIYCDAVQLAEAAIKKST